VSGAGRPAAGTVDGSGLTLALAVTRWHAEITDSLLERALAAAKACGIDDPLVVRVPGAVELPVVAAELAAHHDAVACLGTVIRGGTPHFEYVCDAVTYGLARVALDAGKPVTPWSRPASGAGWMTVPRTKDGRRSWRRSTRHSCCAPSAPPARTAARKAWTGPDIDRAVLARGQPRSASPGAPLSGVPSPSPVTGKAVCCAFACPAQRLAGASHP